MKYGKVHKLCIEIITLCLKRREKQYGGDRLKIKYHACVRYEYTYSQKLLSLLIAERIEYSYLAGTAFVFDFFSDNPKCDEILYLLKDNPLTIPMAVYSKGEMGKAEWFLMEATRTFIETNNFEYTFDMLCEYQTSYDTRYHHIVQKNPYVVKRIPKWKPKFNFCSEGSGDFSTIFCSDEAREKLIESKIQGIEFLPLLKGDLVTPQRKVHQLSFSQKLPITAFDFIRPYKEQICQNCGKITWSIRSHHHRDFDWYKFRSLGLCFRCYCFCH